MPVTMLNMYFPNLMPIMPIPILPPKLLMHPNMPIRFLPKHPPPKMLNLLPILPNLPVPTHLLHKLPHQHPPNLPQHLLTRLPETPTIPFLLTMHITMSNLYQYHYTMFIMFGWLLF